MERPEQFTRTGLFVHKAVMSLHVYYVHTLYLTKVSHKPVKLPNNCVVAGPLCVLNPETTPAEAVAILREPQAEPASAWAVSEAPADRALMRQTTGLDTSRSLNPVEDEEQEGSGASKISDKDEPMPDVAWHLNPKYLRGRVEDLLTTHNVLWAGQLGEIEVPPHRIEL